MFRLTANAANLFPSSFRTLLLLVAVESPFPFRFVLDFLLSSSNPGGYVAKMGVDRSSITSKLRLAHVAKMDVSV